VKRIVVILFLSVLSVPLFAADGFADLVAHWNFNSLTAGSPPSNANQTSYATASGTGTLDLVGWTSRAGATSPFGINNFAGSTINIVGADASGQALALEGGTTSLSNNGASLVMSFNLSTYQDPILTYATRGTGTGFSSNQLAYSTDGVNYTNFGAAYSGTPTSFFLQTFDLSSVSALDGAATAFLRITFSGATGASGNNRLDNIQLNATAAVVPEASAFLFGGLIAAVAGLKLGGRKFWARKTA
jgi:hypothetical protein